jgi:PleD family two-component response regulator
MACQRAGYDVTALLNVQKALDTATLLQPDLIIAAATTPGINELLQQIRSNPRTKLIPVARAVVMFQAMF